MEDLPLIADAELRLRAVDALYDGVLNPAHYGAIIEAVTAIFEEAVGDGGDVMPVAPQLARLGPHVTKAMRLLEIARPATGGRLGDFLNGKPFAAMAVTRAGRVLMMNEAAAAMLGTLKSVADLPLRADAHLDVKAFLAGADRMEACGPAVVGGWHPTEDRALLFVLEAAEADWGSFSDLDERRPSGPLILVKSTETRLSPRVWSLIGSAFDLTSAELDVVRELTSGRSLREISGVRARSLNTVKTQLIAALRKSGTRTQGQLLCMVTALAHVVVAGGAGSLRESPLVESRSTVSLRSVGLTDGSTQKYVVSGAENGHPVLLLAPTNRPDFSPAIVNAFAERGLTVFAPVRPGSWGVSRPRAWNPGSAARIYLSLLDQLSLRQVGLAGLRTGGTYAVELARRAPERFAGLALIDTGVPIAGLAGFAAMPPWPRTLYTTARLYPDLLLLPFRFCASDFFSSAEGANRAIRTFYRDSPIDLGLLRNPELYEIARRNLAYYLENPDQVARDIGHWVRDWSAELQEVCAALPVRFLHGSANPGFPADAVRKFCRKNPGTSATIAEGTAMFHIYTEPERLAEELSRVAPEHTLGTPPPPMA